MRLLSSLVIAILLISCITQQKCAERFPPITNTVIKDSIVTVHDTVTIPGKTVTMEVTSPCPPQVIYHSEIKKNGITSIVDIKNGVLTQACKEDSLKQVIEEKEHYIISLKQVTPQTIERPVRDFWFKLGWFFAIIMFLIWLGIAIDRFVFKNKL